MPPKNRAKSGAGSAQGQKWEQALMSTPLCDEDTWIASVSLVVGNEVEDYDAVDILNAAVASGVRKLFSIISRKELIDQVNELGNPKGKKPKEIPANSEICEAVKPFLDAGEDIPLPLLAKLLKWRMLDIKQRDIRRRDVEKKGGGTDGKTTPKKGDKKDRQKSPAKGKGGKKTPEPSAKGETKLRKRGEEESDSKFIDDEPDDGPQHYILVTGFHNPHLPIYLHDCGIALDCIIKVSTQDKTQLKSLIAATQDQSTDANADELRQMKEVEKSKLEQFWKDVLLLMQNSPAGSKLHDVARLEYKVTAEKMPASLQEPEKKMEFGLVLFEDVACMIYDLHDAKRLWQAYLMNLKLIHVPTGWDGLEKQSARELQSPGSAGLPADGKQAQGATATISEIETRTTKSNKEIDMRYYNEMMNNVPLESVSVPLVMHCMLEQVVAWEEEKDPPSEVAKPPRADGLDDQLAQHISSMVFKLALSPEENEKLLSEFDKPRKRADTHQQPRLIYSRNECSKRLDHLDSTDDLNLQLVELGMLRKLPVASLYQVPIPSARLTKDRAAKLQELLNFLTRESLTQGLTQGEIEHAIKQFVFESMEIANTNDEGDIERVALEKAVPIPWDDPYPLFQGSESELLELQTQLEEKLAKQDFLAEKLEAEMKDTAGPQVSAEDIAVSETASLPSPGRSTSRSRKRVGSAKTASKAESPKRSASLTDSADSRPGSGILKSKHRSSSASSTRSNSSVRFEDYGLPGSESETALERKESGIQQPRSIEDIMRDLQQSQKRVLDQWCFTEHLEPEVLLQVLWDASYNLPFTDSYYCSADESLLVIMHSPIGPNKMNHEAWSSRLHSDVGFRNYLEHVADLTEEWSKTEEARHMAHSLAHEVEQIVHDAEMASRANSAKDKRGRAKSPKRPASRGRSSSRGSSTERPKSGNMFIRAGSLKAAKAEMEQVMREQEELDKAKDEKRARSAQKKREAEEAKEKKPSSRSSSKSKLNNRAEDQPEAEEPRTPEPVWPFTGYDMGNTLLHVYGDCKTAFPADGGQIRTECTEFTQGNVTVKSAILKDGHKFLIHVLNPKSNFKEGQELDGNKPMDKPEQEISSNTPRADDQVDENEVPSPPVVGAFGSFAAQFSNGLGLSYSVYGAAGECAKGKKYEPEPYEVPLPRSPTPTKDPSVKAVTKGKGKNSTPEPVQTDEKPAEEPTGSDEIPSCSNPSFLQLFASAPDGLTLTFLPQAISAGEEGQTTENIKLLVKQSYPFKAGHQHEYGQLRKIALEEKHRVITPDGQVLKFMQNGLVIVLFSDGQVTELTNYPPPVPTRASSPQRPASVKSQVLDRETPSKKQGGKTSQKSNIPKEATVSEPAVEELPAQRTEFITTFSSGEKLGTRLDGSSMDLKDSLVCFASDPYTGQLVATREDRVVIVRHPDGKMVVEHCDGTRITTESSTQPVATIDENSPETGEPPEMSVREIKTVTVECPGYATVRFDTSTNNAGIQFGDGSILSALPSYGYQLHHSDGSQLQISSEGTAIFQPKANNDLETLDSSKSIKYVMTHFTPELVNVTDNENTKFVITNTGDINVTKSADDDEEEEDASPIVTYKQHAPRFFILHKDGTGVELHRYQDIAGFIEQAEDDPSTAILMDPLADHPGVLGITILKPYLESLSKQWVTNYAQPSIYPQGLRSRDLKTFPAREYKKEGPQFGTNIGQGLNVGNIAQSPPRPPVLKCPSKLELRQFMQYKPVSQELRDSLLQGMYQYGAYVLQRDKQHEFVHIVDSRSGEEKLQAAQLSEAARQASAIQGDIKSIYEQATTPVIVSPLPSPQPKRSRADWEKDQREKLEEEINRKALKNREVPSYFDSEFGKAFLLSQAPDMAALTKELAVNQRKGKSHIESQTNETSPDDSPISVHPPRLVPSAPPAENLVDRDVKDHRSMSSTPEDKSSPAFHKDRTGNTPPGLRPVNPSPTHAGGQGSPAPVRPVNPTPAHADQVKDRPINPSPKNGAEMSETPSASVKQDCPKPPSEKLVSASTIIKEEDCQEIRPIDFNVIGEIRDGRVSIPAYITKSGRPSAGPNTRFQKIEEPVRRKVFTSSTLGAQHQGAQNLQAMRGFQLLPHYVDFGVLKEGNTYCFPVQLKNTGVDTCRYKIQQPPPSTGIKILFQPGHVAAGMKVTLNVQIYAIAVGVEGDNGIGKVEHNLLITSETDHLYLPITATVLTTQKFSEGWGQPTPGVSLVSSKPPAGQGVIRPGKHYTEKMDLVLQG